jgi:uncharacterized membrane protein
VLALFEGRGSRSSVLAIVVATLLPLLGVAAVERLNNDKGSGGVVVVLLCALGLLTWTVLRSSVWSDGRVQLMLFSVGLTLIYLYTYRSNHLFGFDIQQEFQRFVFTSNHGRWTAPSNGDPYAAMLSITALPTVLVKMSGVSGTFVFKGVYPMFLAFLPPLTYGFARRWVPARSAVVAAAYLIVLSQFAGQVSGISRQEIGLFFFALLITVLFDTGPGRRHRTTVAVAVLGALVVSHYSSSYVTVAMLTLTWLLYGAVRLVRRGKVSRPVVSGVLVVSGLVMIGLWDGLITASAHNVTSFVASVAENGPNFLPNSGGGLLNRWLAGNVGPTTSPSSYYHLAQQVSVASQPWLHRYPATLVSHFPASAAPTVAGNGLGLTATSARLAKLGTVASELFLALTTIGTLVTVVRRRRSPIPLEVALLCLSFLGFVAVFRVSGTVAGSYNQERAQLQAGMVLCVGLAFALHWLGTRAPRLITAGSAAGLLVLGASSAGLIAQVGAGGSPLLSNNGKSYDQFDVTDQEIAAARWLVGAGGQQALIWTDQYGELRIWAGTTHAAATQTDLTPATINQQAWVFATGYNLAGRAYGVVQGKAATYHFPAAFLDQVMAVVYSSPGARVYR